METPWSLCDFYGCSALCTEHSTLVRQAPTEYVNRLAKAVDDFRVLFFRVYRVVFLYTWVYLFIFWVHWLTECDIITLCLQVKEQNRLETHSSGSHLSHLPCVSRPSVHTVNCQNQCRQLPKSPAAQTIHSSLIFLLSCVHLCIVASSSRGTSCKDNRLYLLQPDS